MKSKIKLSKKNKLIYSDFLLNLKYESLFVFSWDLFLSYIL